MVRVLEPSQPLVAPVRGQGVLDEIVRPYGEEGRLLGELRGAECGRRSLDHHSRLDLAGLHPFQFELPMALLEPRLCGSQLFDISDHREHDLEVAVGSGAQNGTQLGLEELGCIQAHPYSAPAKERVLFVGLVHAGQVLVASHIKRTNDDGLLAERVGYGRVRLVLLIFGRELITLHEQELGAEEPDAFGAPIQRAFGLGGRAEVRGDLDAPPTLTLIDYSLPSTTPRLWVFDMRTGKILLKELVAHGRNTGDNMAERFSDAMESRESSIGLFRTADTYVGHNGYSLRLDGLEPGFNGNARERAIVMHGAPYVNADVAKANGRLGRSWGCPALSEAVARQVIDTVRGGGVIFSYYPDAAWLKKSHFLNCPAPKNPAAITVATN